MDRCVEKMKKVRIVTYRDVCPGVEGSFIRKYLGARMMLSVYPIHQGLVIHPISSPSISSVPWLRFHPKCDPLH